MKTKQFFLIICLLCSSFAITAQDKLVSNFFDKYENEDDVTIISISKAMFKMMPVNSINTGNADLSSIMSKIESMRIITSEKKELKDRMAADSKALFAKNSKYEELIRIKDGKSNVVFNAVKNGNLINELIMLVNDESDFVVISILGNFTVEDIQKIAKNTEVKQ
jgi:hypothetical protein